MLESLVIPGIALLPVLRALPKSLASFSRSVLKVIIALSDIESGEHLGEVVTFLKNWKITLKPLI